MTLIKAYPDTIADKLIMTYSESFKVCAKKK